MGISFRMNIESAIECIENNINFSFSDKSLISEALTHSSYANERKINKLTCNERLEFLGDAVLEMISSDYLFKKYPDMSEGELSKLRASLVCEPALAVSARKIELGSCLMLGRGEEHCGGRNRDSVTSDAFEAVIGAIFIDAGIEKAREFIEKYVLYDTDSFIQVKDSKSVLQEIVQAKKNKKAIRYELIGENGPEHDKNFVVAVFLDDEKYGEATGKSKKAAEKEAARIAIDKLKTRE